MNESLQEIIIGALIAGVVIFIAGGIGVLMYTSNLSDERVRLACIETGKQLISGNCVGNVPTNQ